MRNYAETKLAFFIELHRTAWVIKRLKDYIIDAPSCEGDRPLGGAVGLLRHHDLFDSQRSKTTNLNKEIPDLDWFLFSLLFLKFSELKNGGIHANRNTVCN